MFQTVDDYNTAFPNAWPITPAPMGDSPALERRIASANVPAGTGIGTVTETMNWDSLCWDGEVADCFGPTLQAPGTVPPQMLPQPASLPKVNLSLPGNHPSSDSLEELVQCYTNGTTVPDAQNFEKHDLDLEDEYSSDAADRNDQPSSMHSDEDENSEEDEDEDDEDEDDEDDEDFEDDAKKDPKTATTRHHWNALTFKRPVRKHSRVRSKFSVQHNRRAKSVADMLTEIPGMEKIRWQSVLQSTRGPEVGDREIQRRVKEAEIIGSRLFGGDMEKLLASLLNQHLEFLVEYVRTSLSTPKRRHRRARELLWQCLTQMREKNESRVPDYSSGSESERSSSYVPSPIGTVVTSSF